MPLPGPHWLGVVLCVAWSLPLGVALRRRLRNLPDAPPDMLCDGATGLDAGWVQRFSRHGPGLWWSGAVLLAAACGGQFGPTPAALAATFFVLVLWCLAWADGLHGLLPDVLTLPLLWVGLLVNLGHVYASLPDAVLGAAAGYLFLWALYHAFLALTGREGMGYGDFKLTAALGAWLGWQALPGILFLASLAGLCFALWRRMTGRRGGAGSGHLSFGPWLAAAGAWALFFPDFY